MLLHAHNITFAYGSHAVLQAVSVSLQEGQVVALLGPNGSGKTTLIRILLNQLSATGDIQWQGRPLRDWRRRDLARLVAYLPQAPTFEIEQTVADVLRMGRSPYWSAFGIESEQDMTIVRDVAQALHLTDLLNRPMAELSGGQRQRVFLGRCLVQQPKAMLLDEPNTYLDLKHQVELATLLQSIARERGIGILLASHDLNLASRYSDHLILLQEGRLVTQGNANEVMRPELLENVYGLPLIQLTHPTTGTPLVTPA